MMLSRGAGGASKKPGNTRAGGGEVREPPGAEQFSVPPALFPQSTVLRTKVEGPLRGGGRNGGPLHGLRGTLPLGRVGRGWVKRPASWLVPGLVGNKGRADPRGTSRPRILQTGSSSLNPWPPLGLGEEAPFPQTLGSGCCRSVSSGESHSGSGHQNYAVADDVLGRLENLRSTQGTLADLGVVQGIVGCIGGGCWGCVQNEAWLWLLCQENPYPTYQRICESCICQPYVSIFYWKSAFLSP